MASNRVSRAVTLTVLIAAGLGTVRAAEKIRWEDLQKRLGQPVEFRSVNVVTRDGQKYHSQRLKFRADQVGLYNRDNLVKAIPRRDVARVEIRQRKRYYRHIAENIGGPLGLPILLAVIPLLDPDPGSRSGAVSGVVGFAIGAVLAPPLLAYGVASAPVLLAADGVAFFIPPRVLELVQ